MERGRTGVVDISGVPTDGFTLRVRIETSGGGVLADTTIPAGDTRMAGYGDLLGTGRYRCNDVALTLSHVTPSVGGDAGFTFYRLSPRDYPSPREPDGQPTAERWRTAHVGVTVTVGAVDGGVAVDEERHALRRRRREDERHAGRAATFTGAPRPASVDDEATVAWTSDARPAPAADRRRRP